MPPERGWQDLGLGTLLNQSLRKPVVRKTEISTRCKLRVFTRRWYLVD